ncbi:MAG: UDP-N-acetylmuramoyl-tripeptide--D-alanyl-D-alanine ligase [Candidatus Binatia bacterium]
MNSLAAMFDVRQLLWRWYLAALYILAFAWRFLLFRTTFIAITGSVGKTTTKECLATILSAENSCAKTLRNQNDRYGVPRTLLRVRPWHRFAVIEIGTDRHGMIRRSARLVRPRIAVVLAIGRTHTNVFQTLEDTAAEKACLVEALPPDGLAILNGDDPRVRRMADTCQGDVKMFGRSKDLDLWADEVFSVWPARLSLRVHTGSNAQTVQTNLAGEQWVNSVLAALLAAHSCGVSLKAAAAALEKLEPFAARMQPVQTPTGAIFLRDEYNGSPDTLRTALAVLQHAHTDRRVLVMSNVADLAKSSRVRFTEMGELASQAADLAVFISPHAHYAVKAAVAAGMKPECAHGFTDLQTAAEYLKTELRSGDLVLLRGRATDHLSRIFFAQFGTIGCWKRHCRKTIICDFCPELRPTFAMPEAFLPCPR